MSSEKLNQRERVLSSPNKKREIEMIKQEELHANLDSSEIIKSTNLEIRRA